VKRQKEREPDHFMYVPKGKRMAARPIVHPSHVQHLPSPKPFSSSLPFSHPNHTQTQKKLRGGDRTARPKCSATSATDRKDQSLNAHFRHASDTSGQIRESDHQPCAYEVCRPGRQADSDLLRSAGVAERTEKCVKSQEAPPRCIQDTVMSSFSSHPNPTTQQPLNPANLQ